MRLATSFVLGYHGCDADVGEKILSGIEQMKPSQEEYDWLGPGIYFWEADPKRAWEWAEGQVRRGRYRHPFVVGAVIDLGRCLDLLTRQAIEAVEIAYGSLKSIRENAETFEPLPINEGRTTDLEKRHLDCAVIKHLHAMTTEAASPSFETVRGLFREGPPLYENAGFYAKTHIQIAVCNADNIKGYFRVR